MTGKRYYLTKLADWQRHAARFQNSHWLALGEARHDAGIAPDESTSIVVLAEGDEGAHLTIEDDPAFRALPHPLSPEAIPAAAAEALAAHGVAPGSTMFDAAEALGRVHPLLRHRVF
jgi:hypothetical protein